MMKTDTIPRNALRNLARCSELSDEEWVAFHVPRFKKVRPHYEEYKIFLESVLNEASRKYAPMAIVNARPKGIPSFAEKILRKRKLYIDPKDPQPPDPLVRMTDLCGGRVITQTAQQVEQVCDFIKSAFDIDWPNSEDTSQRLKPNEFGYRSVHYIVQVNPAKLKAAGIQVPVPRSLLGPVCPERNGCLRLKAEIQVRTLLEHASADIGHDTLYKTGMKVPNPILRQFAALAAVLEGADREFGRLLTSLNDLKSNFGAWHRPDEVKHEMNRLRIILKYVHGNQELAVKIGHLALAIGEHQAALDVLKPFKDSGYQGVQRVRGLALTEMHWDHPSGNDFSKGVEFLESACSHSQTDAETLCALAECYAHCGDDERAGELFRKAIVLDPTEPLSFCRFLEFEVARQRNDAVVRLTEPMIQRAMERCRQEIQAGVNLPVAWSCLAIFQLLLGQSYPAIESLTQVLTLCGKPTTDVVTRPQPCAAGRVLRRTRETVRHLHCIREKLEGYEWFDRLLTLALAVLVKDAPALKDLRVHASWGSSQPYFHGTDSVVILSGGCAREVQPSVNVFRPHFERAVAGLSFILLSGGTRMGVSGVAGYVAECSRGRIRAFGYLPVGVPADKKRFFRLIKTPGTDFTPLDPLQGWTDLIAACVDPRRVKLISFAGGHISRVEYAVALAFGARVGMVESDVVPAERRFNNPLWQDHPHLIRLPLDAMTLRAFLQVDGLPLAEADKKRLEPAARRAHEDYMQSARPRDPSLQPWEELDENLKISNYHQVAYWENALREVGLGVRKFTKKDQKHDPLNMDKVVGKKGILYLAEIEHGRWNVERLGRGWRYAETKDITNKLNPCLVPWPKLVDINGTDYQPYDIQAVRGLPKKLREVGLELYKL
jgi:ppGpp synthetase/RelA/SpoT-type nucleotidyltranferase